MTARGTLKPTFVALASVLASLLVPAGSAAAAAPGGYPVTDELGTYVPGQMLVKFKPGAALQVRRASLARKGHEILAEMQAPDWAVVSVVPGQTVAEAVAAYRDDPGVAYAQPDFVYWMRRTPDDPIYTQIWGLQNTDQKILTDNTQPPGSAVDYPTNNPPGLKGNDINAYRAWDTLTDCSGVPVAVLDSGVNYDHVDLAANMWSSPSFVGHGWNSVEKNSNPWDTDGHGTHVAGTIGAVGNNGIGVTGVCWKASIMAMRVIDTLGAASTANVVDGIYKAIERGAKVINMSLGGTGMWNEALATAMTAAMNADVVVVVAAGNEESDNDKVADWPCNFSLTLPNVICVAALDQKYALANFSNTGATSVTMGAPGTNVVSTYAGTGGRVADPLTGGWTITSGWNYGTYDFTSGRSAILADPGNFPIGKYLKNVDDRAYKSFAIPATNIALLKFYGAVNVTDGDYFRVAYQVGGPGTNPFAGGGTLLDEVTKMASGERFIPVTYDMAACKNATCAIGFQMQSLATGAAAAGIAITSFRITTLDWNTTSYATMSGTSMASPMVAGVVALVRAHNPRYGYADVVNAVTTSGRDVPALDGKTRTGKAVDAMRAIAFIQPPTGLVFVVQ